jgi:hypothetical protein
LPGKSEARPPLLLELRTPSLNPNYIFEIGQSSNERIGLVEALCQKRSAMLREEVQIVPLGENDLSMGRLLSYYPDEIVWDGASQVQSKGFFDENDAPPWDTWLCYFEGSLVSWVPKEFFPNVDAGIAVNVVDCITWTSDWRSRKLFGPLSWPDSSSGSHQASE